jgi:glycosyltransferase involved in cell wall biosynthesis
VKIAVLIPAHEEAERIEATVKAALSIPGVTHVVVADDGSEDDTDQVAEAAGAKVVRLFGQHGKGTALEAGALRIADADIVLLLDADLGDTAEQGALLLAPLLAGEADMSIARFPRVDANAAGFGLVKNLARWGIHRYGSPEFEALAPLSGQRALTRACLATVRPFSAGYGVEVGLTIRALRAGFRLVEVETTMAHSATGRDLKGFVHRGRQFVHVAVALARLARQRTPERMTGDEI